MSSPFIFCPFQVQQVQPQTINPVINVPAPHHILLGKSWTKPQALGGGQDEYSGSTSLAVRLSTNPPNIFQGEGFLFGTNLDKLVVPHALLASGIVTITQRPVGGQHRNGLLIRAGALAAGLTIAFEGQTASANHRDVALELSLQIGGPNPIGANAVERLTVVELTLKIADRPRRNNGPQPALLGAYEKINTGGQAYVEGQQLALPRTALVIRRAVPQDFPGTLRVQVDPGAPNHLMDLVANEVPQNGEQTSSSIAILNANVNAQQGALLYVRGLAAHADFVVVNLMIDGFADTGDYVSVAVDAPVSAEWSHSWMYPEITPWTAANAKQEGDDRAVGIDSVEIVVDAPDLPANAPATVTVHRCNDAEEPFQHPGLANLQLDGQGRVVDVNGQRPRFTINGRMNAWKPWANPFLFFKVSFPTQGLSTQTSKDYANREAQCLRIKYLHSFLVDHHAVDIETVLCRNDTLERIYGGPAHGQFSDAQVEQQAEQALAHHRFLKPVFANQPAQLAPWLEAMRNTYSYFHFTHGGYGGTPGQPDFYCSVAFQNKSFHFLDIAAHTNQPGNCDDLPRFLMFVAACHSGWDARLAQVMIANRQHCYYIGFHRTVVRSAIEEMASQFFYQWLVTHGGDPSKIPAVFNAVSPAFDAVKPRLFARNSDFTFKALP